MKRFLYTYSVTAASGTQTFYVDAETQEEADELIQAGGEIYSNDVEVTDLGEPDRAGETNIDDYGDFGPLA